LIYVRDFFYMYADQHKFQDNFLANRLPWFIILIELHGVRQGIRNERDALVRERMPLVIRVSSDKQHTESVAKELHRARPWAYKR
jgi:hypothetical protein